MATQDSVMLYDTQHAAPFCKVSNLHYAPLTDVSWTLDGLTMLISSTDGFCSLVEFMPDELGIACENLAVVRESLVIERIVDDALPVHETSAPVHAVINLVADVMDVEMDGDGEPVEMNPNRKEIEITAVKMDVPIGGLVNCAPMDTDEVMHLMNATDIQSANNAKSDFRVDKPILPVVVESGVKVKKRIVPTFLGQML